MEPEHHFRFLDLPAELRNNIYELCFIELQPIVVERMIFECTSYPYTPPPLLLVNKQIYNESLLFFYCAATFIFQAPSSTHVDWFMGRPAHVRKAITSIQLTQWTGHGYHGAEIASVVSHEYQRAVKEAGGEIGEGVVKVLRCEHYGQSECDYLF